MYLIGYCYGLVILYIFDRACITRLHATVLHHEQHVVSKLNEKNHWKTYCLSYRSTFYVVFKYCGILSKQISYHKIDNLNLLFLYDHLCSLNRILFSVLPLADLCIEYILPIIEKIVEAHRIKGLIR